MITYLKKKMLDSTFAISGLLEIIRSWRVYPTVEVKVSSFLQAFEFTSTALQFLHLPLKSPITIRQNIFDDSFQIGSGV